MVQVKGDAVVWAEVWDEEFSAVEVIGLPSQLGNKDWVIWTYQLVNWVG